MRIFINKLFLTIFCVFLMAGELLAGSIEVVSKDYVIANTGQPGFVLVDVRSNSVYNGKSPKEGVRGGHIPGAINFPQATMAEASDKDLEDAGITKDTIIIVYCNTGKTSQRFAENLLSRGYPNIKNYTGSMYEWAADENNPVETASK